MASKIIMMMDVVAGDCCEPVTTSTRVVILAVPDKLPGRRAAKRPGTCTAFTGNGAHDERQTVDLRTVYRGVSGFGAACDVNYGEA